MRARIFLPIILLSGCVAEFVQTPAAAIIVGTNVRDLGTVDASVLNSPNGALNVKAFGAKGDGVTQNVDAKAIQAAIAAAAKQPPNSSGIYIPAGIYLIDTAINLASGVDITCAGKYLTTLKIATTSGIAIFNSNQAKLSNIKILGCGFDGSINYPADSKTAPSSVAHNIGIYFHSDETPSGQTAHDYQNIEVSDNYFYKLTWGSVYFKGLNMANLQITDNWAKYGSYGWDVYSVFNQGALHPPTGYDYASTGVIIARNHTTLNGPQLLWDPTNSGYASSTDGIQVRGSKQAVVANNTVSYTGGEGIRIEVDNGSTVTGNVVSETGGDGIIVYNQSKGTVITGNTVKNWGRTPLASSIRNYGGTYVVAREFPYATGPKLPSNPLTTNWFSKWPYSTASSQMQTSKIQRYSTTDYYNPATGAGILPFRGFAGIGIYSGSYNVTVTGNQTIPNLSKDSTGYLYASDFGLSCVHPVNGPVGGTCAGGTISGNTFAGRVYPIYHPAYMDPINRHGAVGR